MPGQHRAGEVRHGDAVRADVRALVGEDLVFQAEDIAATVHGGAQAVQLLARVVGGHKVLVAVLDPFHRALQP